MSDVIIVGAGDMAVQYAKVLAELRTAYTVVGRGEDSAKRFEQQTGHRVVRGGVKHYIETNKSLPQYAIVTVYPVSLMEVSLDLIAAGVKKILVEKPAGINKDEIQRVSDFATSNKADVYVAYNRRFYGSTMRAKQIIMEDGGVTSFNFEFTEWSHLIKTLKKPKEEFNNWFLANSTHVVDLAFYLGGVPIRISTYTQGALDWYDRASRFAGAGITDNNALFSYKANWDSAGRWSVEVLTNKRKLIFEPLETLKQVKKGSVTAEEIEIDDTIDKNFKAGLFWQTKQFLEGERRDMISIEKHARMANIYACMESEGMFITDNGWNTYKAL